MTTNRRSSADLDPRAIVRTSLSLAALLVAAPLPLGLAQEPTPAESMEKSAAPGWSDDLVEALKGGRFWLKFRYRYETVDQDGIPDRAHAATLRSVLGYESAPFHGFSGLIEFEDVSATGDALFNDTLNGFTTRPVVADPDSSEVNQAYVKFARDAWDARAGRQRITLGNHRFVGNVGWRQNEQTFDAVSAKTAVPGGIDVFYAYVHNVNRIFGESGGDHPMDSHLVNASGAVDPVGKITGYFYHLDYDTMNALSSTTYGARLDGGADITDTVGVSWAGEYAHQEDAGDNTADVDASYFNAEVGGNCSAYSIAVGFEMLEGDRRGQAGTSFQTPLATGHKFNGWADLFLTTPANGLEDYYAVVSGSCEKAKLSIVYHEFRAERSSADYGSELDIVATYEICPGAAIGAKFANYQAQTFMTDREKFWFWASLGF